jgi:hypothetical protein
MEIIYGNDIWKLYREIIYGNYIWKLHIQLHIYTYNCSLRRRYSLVPMSPLEDWLLNEALGESTTEGPSQARAANAHTLHFNSNFPWTVFSSSFCCIHDSADSRFDGCGGDPTGLPPPNSAVMPCARTR